MVKSLFKRFPSLTEESVNYNDAVDMWHGRLKNHFKSQRFRWKENTPEIILKRQLYGKRKSSADKLAEPRRKKLCWGMENFLPDLPEGEDDTTYSRYQQDLKEQHNLRKESRDKSVISILMNKTFAHRRHLLVKEFVQLKTLIADYPLLCCEKQVQSLCLFACICPKDENALAFDGSFFLQVF